ncbi:MAG: hypothetical protein JWM37_355 [Candidatus Saccharibacteria bacterium]|nr:hypothetical protein [Candidatus Saccharibacteria bacterium]
MKIGLILDDSLDPTDGVQQYALTFGRWLTTQGHEVHYLVGETTRTDIANVHSLSRNVKVRFNGNRMRMPLPTSREKLGAFLEAERFDVLHIQMPYSPWLGGRLLEAAPAHTKIVATFHIVPNGAVADIANKCLAVWTRRSARRISQVIAVSQAAADFCKKTYGLRSVVLPNVVDASRYAVAKQPNPVPHIIFLGRLVPRKNAITLLKALESLTTHEYCVTIAGDGPLRGNLEQYVKQKNIKNVSFTGYVDEAEKPRLLASADISVFPSLGGESFGIVLVEAMASGASVVLAGDNVGYRGVMADTPDVVFQPADHHELAIKIQYYLDHPDKRNAIAKLQARHARQYDPTAVGPAIIDIYNSELQATEQ